MFYFVSSERGIPSKLFFLELSVKRQIISNNLRHALNDNHRIIRKFFIYCKLHSHCWKDRMAEWLKHQTDHLDAARKEGSRYGDGSEDRCERMWKKWGSSLFFFLFFFLFHIIQVIHSLLKYWVINLILLKKYISNS